MVDKLEAGERAIERFDRQERHDRGAWKRLDEKLAALERKWRFP